ncbi:MAG: hypothetical protein BRC23_01110 [Parcubacteria group bacterium SW_4_49_11]|nr:MAG: hypothetical protein BRC23_01110 [Parcubacteria group bacterium SW_4_49_11]
MPDRLRTFLQGLIMGATEVIPGVSSSTLALVMGIYEAYVEFLFEISEAVKRTLWKPFQSSNPRSLKEIWGNVSWRFGLTLIGGMVVAILGLARLLEFLLGVSENGVFAFFFGLVLGAVWIPFRRISARTVGIVSLIVLTAITFFFLFHFVNPVAVDPPLWLFFLGGFIGVSAMVLPGISGSFVLLIVGVYKPAIALVSSLVEGDISFMLLTKLITLGLGVLLGFLLFIRVVRYALQRWHDVLMAFLGGLMLASLRFLWPFAVTDGEQRVPQLPWNMDANVVLLYGLLILLGITSVIFLQRQRSNYKE